MTKSRNCADDSLLETVVNVFAEADVHFKPATDYVPKLLVKEGQLTRRAPTSSEWKDISFGWEIAKELGRLDIGQSVCVKDQAVMALEAIEGTDKCILRAGELCRTGGFTVVKVAKPQQDMRYDVPTVGLRTLKNMLAGQVPRSRFGSRPGDHPGRAGGGRLRQPARYCDCVDPGRGGGEGGVRTSSPAAVW